MMLIDFFISFIEIFVVHVMTDKKIKRKNTHKYIDTDKILCIYLVVKNINYRYNNDTLT